MKFPSHLTDKMQPPDKCVFCPVKLSWKTHLINYGKQQMGRGSGRLPKNIFFELLFSTWTESNLAKNILSGFKSTGIYPVDSTMFPEKEFSIEDLEIYRNSLQNLRKIQYANKAATVKSLPNTTISRSEVEQNISCQDCRTNLSETVH